MLVLVYAGGGGGDVCGRTLPGSDPTPERGSLAAGIAPAPSTSLRGRGGPQVCTRGRSCPPTHAHTQTHRHTHRHTQTHTDTHRHTPPTYALTTLPMLPCLLFTTGVRRQDAEIELFGRAGTRDAHAPGPVIALWSSIVKFGSVAAVAASRRF